MMSEKMMSETMMSETMMSEMDQVTRGAPQGLYQTLSSFDAWRARRSYRTLQVAILGLCVMFVELGATSMTSLAHADEVNEFDSGSDGWTAYPSTMGRSSESGWVNVRNDGEGSIRNNPTGTRYTYYWKLTRDIDLTELADPSLELKYHFKGHAYDYFRVQVGEEGARRLSDFTTLHESTSATAEPEEVSLDLSEYAGQRIRIQLLLRKPYDVVENRIGLYIHRVAVVTPPPTLDLEDRPGELRLAAFNVQVFGLSKMDRPEVVSALTEITTRFDLVMIQEIRDISESAIATLLEEINAVSPVPYALELSERLGRTSSKEQIAFIYRTDKLELLESGVTPDPEDFFERPPVWARFEHLSSGERMWILGAHLDPDDVPSEIAQLYEVFSQHQRETPEGESSIVMGDLNAGCRYLNQEERALTDLFMTSALISLIDDHADTTTTSTYCPYDRLLVGGNLSDSVAESGVYRFDQLLGLTGEQTRAVSDHYPVWARFQLGDGL